MFVGTLGNTVGKQLSMVFVFLSAIFSVFDLTGVCTQVSFGTDPDDESFFIFDIA